MTGKKGAMTHPFCHCEAHPLLSLRGAVAVARRSRSKLEHEIPRFTLGTGSAIPKLNPKLKALNPKQILISKFKTQKLFWSLGFWSFDIV
jgi:hypothetical protein